MRLIVHAGLHQTDASRLQQAMSDHRAALLGRGVYYARQEGCDGHDFAAWDILRHEFSPVTWMVEAARFSGCHTVILSSQDLEGLLFDRAAAAGLEKAAAAAGVGRVEWHFCLRDPGDYFAALHARLHRDLYADPAAMLFEILRDGMMLVMDPLRGGNGAPFWGFCFDHLRYVSAFAARTAHPVRLHDFADAAPIPGWRLLESVGALDAVVALPGPEPRDAPPSPEEVREGYCRRILGLLSDEGERARLRPLLESQLCRQAEAVGDYARTVGELFAPGTAAALQIFGCPGQQGVEPLRACA